MFPPVDQKILQSNPEFAKLYRIITTAILNPDGSTKEDAEAKDRAAVQKVGFMKEVFSFFFTFFFVYFFFTFATSVFTIPF
jgi:hypothetical protein